MGNWNIQIDGIGCHHNNPAIPVDANVMAAEFVRQLKEAGHSITRATVTQGYPEDLDPPKTAG